MGRLRQLWVNNKAGVLLGILTVIIGVALLIFAKKLTGVL